MVGERLDMCYILTFITLSAARVWARMTAGRVKFLEQQPRMAWKRRARFFISLTMTVIFDVMMFFHAANTMRNTARRTMPMFAFEFADLILLSSSATARYLWCTVNVAKAGVERSDQLPFDGEPDALDVEPDGGNGSTSWLFHLELWTDTSRCALSLHYILIWSTSYASCAHVMRDAAAPSTKSQRILMVTSVVDG